MSGVGQIWREHLRLALLKVLDEQPGYSANASLMSQAMRTLGLVASRDQVEAELAWLAEQGLVDLEALGPVTVAQITARGQEAAQGIVAVPGVKKPGPRA